MSDTPEPFILARMFSCEVVTSESISAKAAEKRNADHKKRNSQYRWVRSLRELVDFEEQSKS